jgi:hypothetical protein
MERGYMKSENINRATLLVTAVACLLIGGCGYFQQKGPEKPPAPQVDKTPAKYESGGSSNLTPVESSLLLSEKYAVLAVDSEKLRQDNKRLTDENVALTTKVAKLQGDYDQASKELKEANSMLIDMRIELNNWKNSVLGFRDEMRESQKVQLEALLKVMQLLGGESQNQGAKTQDDPNQAK